MPANAAPRLSIGQIFEPRRVAVFGASDDRGKWGGRIMHYLALHGFAGEPVPINPRRETVHGRRCYARIGDAPQVDVAVIAVPAASVPSTLRECAAAGVGCCVIITAGFAEAGAEGELAQKEIEAIAAQSGMRLVGPNCLGLINFRNGMALTSARVLDVEKIHKGHIGLVSQSGALMLSVYNRAHDQGIGFSQIVSVGNQADLEVCDFFEHMIADPDTKAICLHIEGLRDGMRYLDLLRRSRQAGKPVIVLKTGRSAQGEEAARSHTASLAGAYAVFAAASREAGAILVDDPDVMVLLANFLLRYGPARAGTLGIISSSGGMNGIVADRMADIGLEFARFDDKTRKALSAILLPGHLDNPVDMGARRQDVGEAKAIAQPIAAAVAADPNVGVVFIPLTTIPNYEVSVAGIADGLNTSDKPALFALTPGSVATGVRSIIREKGIPYCDRIDDAMRLLRAYVTYRPGAGAPARPKALPFGGALPSPGYLSEPEAKALLASFGVRVTRETRVGSREDAAKAAEAIGFPVVLKGVSRKVVHKSDAGLVRLGLDDANSVLGAFDEVRARLAELDPGAQDCIVAEMVHGELELIIGVKHDPQFGPAVMVGSGGVLVELLGDVEVALAPLSPETAQAMLGKLRVWPLLEGFRGRPALDVAAVVDTLVKVGELAMALAGRLTELDINPLLLKRRGEGAVAADARAVIA
ncbi:MAG: acetate--CoA ligase family protein [Hyphomicrobiales bacterium]